MNGVLIGITTGVLANLATLALLDLWHRLRGQERSLAERLAPPQTTWPHPSTLLTVGMGSVVIAFVIYLLGQYLLPDALKYTSPTVAILVAVAGSQVWPLLGRPVVWFARSRWLDKLLRNSHMFYFSPNATAAQLEHSHRLIRDFVSPAPVVDIMVGNGYRTLGDTRSLLRDLLESHQGRVRVLMLDPCCESAHRRARIQGLEHVDYLNRARLTLTFLEQQRRWRSGSFDYRLYTSMPVWRLVIAGDRAFIQHLSNLAEPKEAPVYGVRKGPLSWYDAFSSDFHERFQFLKEEPSVSETKELLAGIRLDLTDQTPPE